MPGLALRWNPEVGEIDLQRSSDGYLQDDTTWTLVTISLFTDRRKPGVRGPEARGYWADDLLGSTLWQKLGQVHTADERLSIAAEIRSSLAWLETAEQMKVGAITIEGEGTSVSLQIEVERGRKREILKWGKEAGLYVG